MKPSADAQTPEPLLAHAQAAFAAGQDAATLEATAKALHLRPGWPPALLLRANAGLRSGALDEAIDALQMLCQASTPSSALLNVLATALNNRGSRARRAGDEKAALSDFECALQHAPMHPQAGFNRALSLLALDHRSDAETAFRQHLASYPEDLEARIELTLLTPESNQRVDTLGRLLATAGADALPAELRLRAEQAGPHPERALETLPLLPETDRRRWAWTLGEQLRRHNRIDAARRAYAAAPHHPDTPLRLRIAAALSAPLIADSAEQIRSERQRQTHALHTLAESLRQAPPHAQRLDDLAWSHFPMAYMGEDDTALMRMLGELTQQAAATAAPAFAQAPACRNMRRIVLVASVFRDCTAGAYFGAWIGWLRNAGFEVVVYQLGPGRDAETERMAALANRFHFIAEHTPLDSLAERLHAESAGLILYPELGMDARLYPLAALKLARRQAMAWGHPVTSGLHSLDACFSCSAMEPADADAHYVEALRLLPGLGVEYRRPPQPPAATRADLGLPTHGPLVLAPQSLFKLHPDNDTVYADVLQRLPQAQLLLFDDSPPWREALSQRLVRAGVDLRRTHWLAPGTRARYLQINSACDLMLDSQHFSGGNASLDALQSGLPVLTTPGRFMRGRQTAAMLSRIDLRDALCVDAPGHLAERAVELIASGQAQALRHTIHARLPDLFEADSARRSFIEHVETMM